MTNSIKLGNLEFVTNFQGRTIASKGFVGKTFLVNLLRETYELDHPLLLRVITTRRTLLSESKDSLHERVCKNLG